MLACVDVDYRGEGAVAACVVFPAFESDEVASEHTATIARVEEYVPGELFRRELPCLLAVLALVKVELEVVLVDAYAWLGEGKPGLGARLHSETGIPVIGVAKTGYRDAPAIEVLRGRSAKPLYVTAAGMDASVAAAKVRGMHGASRIPTLIRRVDQLARGR